MTTPIIARNGGWTGFRPADEGSASVESNELINILDTIDIPIVVLLRDFTIACFNYAAGKLFDFAPTDIGRNPRDVSALMSLPNLQEWCDDVLATGIACRHDVHHLDKSFVLRIAQHTTNERQIAGTVLTFNEVTAFRASIDKAIYEREFAKTILNAVSHPLVVLGADLRVQSGNRAFFTMFGISRDDMQARSVHEFARDYLERTKLRALLEKTAKGETIEPFEVEYEFADIGDRTLVLDARQLSLPDHSGRAILLAFHDITDRKQAEAVKARLASVVEFSDDAIISKDLNGIITSWNKGAERIFGYVAEEAIGKPITIVIPQDRQREENEIIERIRRGQRVEHFETVRRRKHGGLIEVALTISPVKNDQGKIVGASKIARDITERKRSEEKIATLGREAEHRAKNILATVQATVHLSRSDTPEGLKHAIVGRIQALANVHTLFVQSRWAGAELRNLVTQELSPYCRNGETRAQIDGPSLLLEPDTAQATAIALHELATNAAKYGAWSMPEGQVQIQWSCAADGQLFLRWSETGGPAVVPPTRKGFGTRVIENMIRAQLKGDVRFDWRPEGVACEIVLPAGNR